MTRSRSASAARGFTLIEVLATLMLIGIILPVAMNGISVALAAASSAKHRAEATILAENKLNELVASGQYQFGSLSGDFSPDYPDYRWSGETYSRDANLSELSVRVFWTSRNQEQSVGLTTMVYIPTDAQTPDVGIP